MSCLMLGNLLILLGFVCVRGIEWNKVNAIPAYEARMDERYLADEQKKSVGIVPIAASGQRIVDYQVITKEKAYSLTQQDMETLLRIVEAEAGCEDEDGRLLVANVVLNRVADDAFPDTISEVVFQREKGVTQFSPVSNGRFWKVKISEKTMNAVGRALEGEDISDGALYFAARKYADSDKMKWFDDNLDFLFSHGGHEFFTSKK